MCRRVVPAAWLQARSSSARLATRASLTAKLTPEPDVNGDELLARACWSSVPATVEELAEVALTAVRWAALALGLEPADVLAGLLTGRAIVEELAVPAGGEGG